jgi:pyridoxine 5-phosphate synthase
MTKLSVNVNKVALLRNTRALGIPDVEKFARIALDAGAHGITVHPRPDGRHVRADDVSRLATLMREYPGREFNIEGNPFYNLMDFVRATRPDQCTLVPDESGQFTSDHGWDIVRDGDRLRPIIDELRSLGVRVSLFMDPLPAAMSQIRALGADRIELYTEPYAANFGQSAGRVTLDEYVATAAAATSAGLGINAGHDLNLANLPDFITAIPALLEVSIGHALVADALEFGFARTVQLYLAAIDRALHGAV